MLELAIHDPEFGPIIRESRILRPEEVKALEVINLVKRAITMMESVDAALAARLEKALDDPQEMRKLTNAYLPEEEQIRLGDWPEGKGFRILEEGTAIKDFVVRKYRHELSVFRIVVVFQEKVPPVNGRGRLGTAAKLPGKASFLSNVDAVVTIGFDEWASLPDKDRQRLVHHELEHYEFREGGLAIRGHDFEDFLSTWELYGPRSESGRFIGDTLGKRIGSQFELIEG